MMGKPKILEIFETMDYGIVLESESTAKKYLEDHGRKLKAFVLGQEYTNDKEETQEIKVLNPCTGEELCVVVALNSVSRSLLGKIEECDVKEQWADLHCRERVKLLYRMADYIEQNRHLLALLHSMATGQLFRRVNNVEVPYFAESLRHAADEALVNDTSKWKPKGLIELTLDKYSSSFTYSWRIAEILAVGNKLLLRVVPEKDFIVLFAVAELFKKAGIPDGVFNVICDRTPTVPAYQLRLEDSLDLQSQSTTVIVFDSADRHSAAVGALATFCNTVSGIRLLVQESVYGKFQQIIYEKFSKLRMGSALDKNADLTPSFAYEFLSAEWRKVLQKTRDQGAKVIELVAYGVSSPFGFYNPVLIDGIQTSSPVLEKRFPVRSLTMLPFRTAKEAIALGNHFRPRGQAVVWTERLALALEVAQQLNSSSVWINGCNTTADARFASQKELLKAPCSNHMVQNPIPAVPTKVKVHSDQPHNDGKCHSDDKEFSISTGLHNDIEKKMTSSARSALASWSKMSSSDRKKILYRIADQLRLRRDEFMNIPSLWISNRNTEFDYAVESLFKWAAICCQNLCGEIVDLKPCGRMTVRRESVGVIGLFSGDSHFLPFVTMTASALSHGNCIVAIPDGDFSQAAKLFFQIFDVAGVPTGVFNVLNISKNRQLKLLHENKDIDRYWIGCGEWDGEKFFKCVDIDFSALSFQETMPLLRSASTRSKIICMTAGEIFAN